MQTATKAHHESPHGNLTLRSTDRDQAEADRTPLFRSLHHALEFAYLWHERTGAKTAKYSEFTGAGGSTLMLTPGEKMMQAENILGVVASHLSRHPAQRAVLQLTHGGKSEPDLNLLVDVLAHLNRNRALLRLIIAREMIVGEKYMPSFHRVAQQSATNASAAWRAAERIRPEIAKLRESAHEMLRPAFERRGWLAREEKTEQ